jgi:hypothetical protein
VVVNTPHAQLDPDDATWQRPPHREAQEPALASVNAQEKAFKDAIADLEAKSNDESLSTVKKNKAKAELAQLKQEDPLPLRKAKIGLEVRDRPGISHQR